MPPAASAATKDSSRVQWLALALILVVLGTAIFLVMRNLQQMIVEQIARQDGYVLYAASKVQLDPEFAQDPDLRAVAIENKALEATQLLTNIIAMRLFDAKGRPQFSFPGNVKHARLTGAEITRAGQLQLASEFQEEADLAAIFEAFPETKKALLRVIVPIESEGSLIGVAEFLMDGRHVQASVQALNKDLWRYGALIFAIGGGITALSLINAFGRLQRANTLLAQRTASLLHANHELTLAAKTSAVGAITAHLIHDLKNPLFGLQSFAAAKGAEPGSENEDWNLALLTTQRMQKMISDIVRILQEEKTSVDYELSIEELFGVLRGKIEPQAREAGIGLKLESGAQAVLANRDANIVLLILTNLAHNAVQAMARGGELRVSAARENADLVFEVADTGPGLPAHLRETLFIPSRSTKSGGTGLGLAISKQLANHAGADLQLKQTSERGTIFQLRLPERVSASVPKLATK